MSRLAPASAVVALLFTADVLSLNVHPPAPDFGEPIAGLTAAQRTAFDDGKEEFEGVEGPDDGLGPVFNGTSCAGCHSGPATGGFGEIVETRFARILGGKFDPMESFGGNLIQTTGIGVQGTCDFVGETVPPEATMVAGRLTTPLFGLGLVDAVPDATFEALSAFQRIFLRNTAGRTNHVTNLATSHTAVGKFGWKGQVPTLFQFSGDAYLNEMGITSPQFPHENCPQGDCNLLVCDPRPDDPEDATGADVQKFADFMKFLAPAPRGPVTSDVRAGEVLFFTTGCFACHSPVLQTGSNPVAALSHVTFAPYSDFLLHDMGSLGDGMEQGRATGREMRTAPLWGVRTRTKLLHDGRATTLADAILAHEGQGHFSRDAFAALSPASRAKLVAFLSSL